MDWLFFTRTLAQGSVSARTQQRRNRLIWSLMPPVPLVRQCHDVVQVDGIWLHRRAVVLVAVADGHVVGWRVARHEGSVVWGLLMGRIAAPRVLVCDGGGGIAKAVRRVWPGTSMQRCLFHIAMYVTALTGMRLRLEAGRQLRRIAITLKPGQDTGGPQGLAGGLQRLGDQMARMAQDPEHIPGRVRDRQTPTARDGPQPPEQTDQELCLAV